MEIINYILVEGKSPGELEGKVMHKLVEGFSAQGGIAITCRVINTGNSPFPSANPIIYTQAMIRSE